MIYTGAQLAPALGRPFSAGAERPEDGQYVYDANTAFSDRLNQLDHPLQQDLQDRQELAGRELRRLQLVQLGRDPGLDHGLLRRQRRHLAPPDGDHPGPDHQARHEVGLLTATVTGPARPRTPRARRSQPEDPLASFASSAVLRFGGSGSVGQGSPGQATPARVSFNRDVRPIMSGTCFRCHGPDESSRRAGMRLDIRDEALKTRRNGTPIVPGQPEASLIITRIFAEDPARVMPPAAIHKELTAAQKETIRRWIAEGRRVRRAVGVSASRASVGSAAAGTVASDRRLRPEPPRDRRLEAGCRGRSAHPAPARDAGSDRLAPTPPEIDAFLADRSPDAYEKVVDRLMASPRYAEKQAIPWLDAVRYADTAGFHGDNPFPAWPYRDWVLRAIRDNKPFDEFTREQLAGDLLPNATTDQKIASAYNRLNRVSGEGGLQEKEYLAKYGADRVRAVTTTWMASTLGCAECHDHKFDPFKAKDFYAMKAFFADINESGLARDGGGRNGPEAWGVKLQMPTPEQKRQLDDLNRPHCGGAAWRSPSSTAGAPRPASSVGARHPRTLRARRAAVAVSASGVDGRRGRDADDSRRSRHQSRQPAALQS